MAKIPTTIHDIHVLLEQADIAMKRAKRKPKEKPSCLKCDKVPKYKGLCEEHLQEDRNERIDAKHGKRWFSTNGYEYCYNSEGKPTLFSRYRMAQLIGRPLQEHETVIQKDGDIRNNEDNNLMLTLKKGVNLMELRCSCGLPYFYKEQGLSELPQEK